MTLSLPTNEGCIGVYIIGNVLAKVVLKIPIP